MERGGVRTFTPWLILDPQNGRTLGLCTIQASKRQVPSFSVNSHPSVQNSSTLRLIYHLLVFKNKELRAKRKRRNADSPKSRQRTTPTQRGALSRVTGPDERDQTFGVSE